MAVTQIGTSLAVGEQTAISGYIVVSETTRTEMNREEVLNEDGQVGTLILYETHTVKDLELIANASKTFSEFPVGAKSTATGYTDYVVEKCDIVKSPGATKASVTLKDYGNIA